MSEHNMETRRRSRSKTPFLRSSCDHESCEHAGEEGHTHHHPKKKAAVAPNVDTIIEETPLSSRTITTTTTITSSSQGPKTSSLKEKAKKPDQIPKITINKSSTTITTKQTSNKLIGNVASSTPKASHMQQSFAAQFSTSGGERGNRLKEIAQNELNTQFERSQRSSADASKRTNNSSWKSNSVNMQNGDLSDHIAYKEYKLAGEYWNKTPKTDYTYSELSPHRRELAPGIIAMPNMSRRGLEMHDDRVFQMIERNPVQEEYIRKRYLAQDYVINRQATEKLLFDSGDELDYTSFENFGKQRNLNVYAKQYEQEKQWWIMRLITTIISSVSSAWTSLTRGSANDSKLYRTHYYAQDSGFSGAIKRGFSSIWRYAYLFISSVLYLDTWLLQSKNANSRGRKRFFLLLLLLLPLLLLGGTYYYLHPNEPFPPKSFSELTQSLPQLPPIPKIDITEYINQEKYDALRAEAAIRFENLRDWTDDYFMYLKTLSLNVVDKSRQYFQLEEKFEPI